MVKVELNLEQLDVMIKALALQRGTYMNRSRELEVAVDLKAQLEDIYLKERDSKLKHSRSIREVYPGF